MSEGISIGGSSNDLLIQVKPSADVTDFQGSFSSEFEKIWTQSRQGVIDRKVECKKMILFKCRKMKIVVEVVVLGITFILH